MVNAPFGALYVNVGASASDISDVIHGRAGSEHMFRLPMLIVGGVLAAGLGVYMIRTIERNVSELQAGEHSRNYKQYEPEGPYSCPPSAH